MTPTDIIVLGVNGNCIDIVDTIELLAQRGKPVRVRGFLDDNPALLGTSVAGYPVLGSIAEAVKFEATGFICGIGSPRSYQRKPAIIAAAGIPAEQWVTIVHPTAAVSPHARLGRGTAVLSGAAVGAHAEVGDHVIVLQNSVISHDAVVGDYTAIATSVSISGLVRIGPNAYLGSNCTIREGLRIGARALVGMGAVVTRDVAVESVVVGNPARPKS